jgi:sugar/nucleoside kinase (ribokinase family)
MTDIYLGVFGHVVVDSIFNVPELPKINSSIATTGCKTVHGGTGANIAMIASRLGVKTALASFVGEGFPVEYGRILENAGIDLTDLKVVDGYSTPQAWIFVDAEQNQMTFFDQGPMADAAKFELQKHTIETSQIIHIGTGRPEYYQRVIEHALSRDKKIAFDPAQELSYVYSPESFKNVVQHADYFFANESELATAQAYLGLKDRMELLELVGVLVVTKGEKGSEIITSEEILSIPIIRSEAVQDITGAGDAYRAGFYAGLQRNLDLERCGLIGSATASFVIEKKGPQTNIPTWEHVERRISESQ